MERVLYNDNELLSSRRRRRRSISMDRLCVYCVRLPVQKRVVQVRLRSPLLEIDYNEITGTSQPSLSGILTRVLRASWWLS